MAKEGKDEFKDYGVDEYVPQEARHYGFMDMVSTWIGANCQPNTWFIGGCLAASGFAVAAGVTLVANPISYIILALVGFIGYKVTTTSMGLMRFPFGIRGSKLPTIFNTVTLIGWTAVGNYLGSISMSYLFNTLWGWPCYGMEGSAGVMVLGTLINAVLTAAFVCVGGSRAVKYAENIAVIAMLILSAWITYSVLKTFPISEIIAWKPSEDVRMSMGVGIDTIVAFSLSWVPCVAEFTRYTKSKKAATVAPVIGATVGIYWFALVGTVAVIASALTTGVFDPNTSDPSSVAAALGLGLPAMFVIVLSVVTTNMISLYSGSISALNLCKKPVSVKKMNLAMGGVSILFSLIPIAMASFLDFFYTFMDFLALVFPPLIAVLIVDFYLIRKRKYVHSEISNETGPYWYKNGFNWYALACWLVGTITFLVFKKCPLAVDSVGAVFPAFFVTMIVYFLTAKYAVSKGVYKDLSENIEQNS